MKNVLLTLCAFIFLFPNTLNAEELNAGFVKGLWYSSPTVFANEPVRIYVALRNHTDRDLTGTVRFNANGKRIGIAYVSALPGRIVEAWTDWTPGYGTTTITATLTEVRFHELGESPETAEVVSTLAEEILFIDYDTDRDGTGDTLDSDDDNDSVSDETEIANGTNPRKADTAKPSTSSAEPENEDENTTQDSERTEDSSAPRNASANDSRAGLERYTPPGRVDDLITTVTERINTTSNSLEAYRAARPPADIPFFSDETASHNTPTETEVGDKSNNSNLSSQPTATITRELPKDKVGIVSTTVTTIKNLANGFYSLLLWVLALLLAHPAIVQILLLLLIVLTIYKLARRVGRRPIDS